ncbi:MAG TPA: Crp/Fnr family transcriptional regulator [Stellaceae bacterium]|jgi:CRP-like cAMP-binding protein|nr:Crp/Fnr family transcriptional regulator [Stellaceae bacterium]
MGLPDGVAPCGVARLARKLEAFAPLDADDLPLLRELSIGTRAVRRREDLIVEGRSSRTVFLVADGILMRYRVLRDGRRQIVNLAVPGDFAGMPGCLFDNALYSVRALTDAQVEAIPIQRLVRLTDTQPRLAAKILWSFACETAIYVEHLILVGRRTALERVAHFLLELLTRLQVIGLADECSYRIRLSQEVIGDALGLSLPYVNRVLRRLSEDGLVTIREHRFTINDIEALAALADFEQNYLKPTSLAEFYEGAR